MKMNAHMRGRLFSIVCQTVAFGLIISSNQAAASALPHFTDMVPNSIGIDVLGNGLFGGGAAWIDYNNDGYADLFIPTAGSNKPSSFYNNNTDGSFTEIAQTANVELIGRSCTGAAVGDINNDGFDDLFVTCGLSYRSSLPESETIELEKNAMLLNNGDGTFSDITDSAGLHSADSRRPSFAAAFGDLDGDADLDLYVGNYTTTGANDCVANQVFINNGDNTFTDKTAELDVSGVGCTLAVVMTDYDMDGDLDIFEINDFGATGSPPNSMFQNNGPGQAFTNVAADIGLDAAVYGMGVAVADYDNDEDLDYYITSIGANVLHQDDGSHYFSDVAPAANVENVQSHPDYPNPSVGWGTVFLDTNNDGLQDLYVTNGGTGFTGDGCKGVLQQCINRLYLNSGTGVFDDVTMSSGTDDEQGSALSVAVADYDRDGDVDMLVTNLFNIPHNLYNNDTSGTGNYLQIRLQGVESNRRGIGAKVRVIAGQGKNQIVQLQELHAGSSHGSNHEFMLHFGLGNHAEARQVIVEWPMGCKQVVNYAPAGNALITEDCSPPHVITGRVTYDGIGLANATLWDALRFPETTMTTDAYGIFTIGNYPDNEPVILLVTGREGFDIQNKARFTAIDTGDSFDNRFEAVAVSGSVTGYLTTPEGDGVAGNEVWDFWAFPERTVTDANGLYALSGFSLGQSVAVIPAQPSNSLSGGPRFAPEYNFIPSHNGSVHEDINFILNP